MNTNNNDYDAYVECAECGHPLERHSMAGCDWQSDGCGCTEQWSYKQISEQRRDAGLSVSFERFRF